MDLLLQAAAVWPGEGQGATWPAEGARKRRIYGKGATDDALDDRHSASLGGLALLSRSAPSSLSPLQDDEFPTARHKLFRRGTEVAQQPVPMVTSPSNGGESAGHSSPTSETSFQGGLPFTALNDARRSTLVDGVPHPLSLDAPTSPLLYEDLINFPRSRGKSHARRCVMCGHLASGEAATCSIPLQNKDVCKRCDTGIWRHHQSAEYFKWCKGCKKFLHVCAFAEKLQKCTSKYSKQPSKCDRCRERGRQSYMSKRHEGGGDIAGPAAVDDAGPNAAASTGGGSGDDRTAAVSL